MYDSRAERIFRGGFFFGEFTGFSFVGGGGGLVQGVADLDSFLSRPWSLYEVDHVVSS